MPPVTHNTSLLQAISKFVNQPNPPAPARSQAGSARPGTVERIEIDRPREGGLNPKAVRGSYLDIVV